MAVVPVTEIYFPHKVVGGNDTLLAAWGPLAAASPLLLLPFIPPTMVAALLAAPPLTFTGLDSGSPEQLPAWADCSFQVLGTFGAGGACVLEGSNDGITYGTLNDPFGVSLSFTTASPRQATERCQFVRPRITAGDGTTALSMLALFRRQPL